MALEVTRIYKNTGDEILRIDHIIMEATCSVLGVDKNKVTYMRRVKKELILSTGVVDRVVTDIQLVTNADTIGNDFVSVSWDSPKAYCNMSDLPGVGDTV